MKLFRLFFRELEFKAKVEIEVRLEVRKYRIERYVQIYSLWFISNVQ